MKKLLLFDVDKTLITAQGHWSAFYRALKEIIGEFEEGDKTPYLGRTDKFIMQTFFRKNNVKITNENIERCLSRTTELYVEDIKKLDIVCCPGVKKLLEILDDKGHILGLVTGNIKEIAYMKLNKAGIGHYFKIGGFGDYETERSELVKYAIKEANDKFGFKGDVFVFGDTLNDVEAAHKADVKCVAVATGHVSFDGLKKSGADLVVKDLAGTEKMIEFIE